MGHKKNKSLCFALITFKPGRPQSHFPNFRQYISPVCKYYLQIEYLLVSKNAIYRFYIYLHIYTNFLKNKALMGTLGEIPRLNLTEYKQLSTYFLTNMSN